MAVRLDLHTLEPADALDLGVLMEEEARQRYIEFSEVFTEVHHNEEAAAFCRVMAGNEERHGAELWERRQRLYPDVPTRVTAAMLFDVEAPETERVGAFMTARECMEMALAAETKAEAFFRAGLAGPLHPEVRTLLAELADEEVEHQRMVKEQIARLPSEGPLSRADVADEPVGQD
jgi:rubrerythrin